MRSVRRVEERPERAGDVCWIRASPGAAEAPASWGLSGTGLGGVMKNEVTYTLIIVLGIVLVGVGLADVARNAELSSRIVGTNLAGDGVIVLAIGMLARVVADRD